MEYSQSVKEQAYAIDPECWVSYSGKPKEFKQRMEVRRVKSLTDAQKEISVSALAELENTQLCPICKRDGEAEPADYTCFSCEKPMCYSHSHLHETEGRYCDACCAK